MKRRIIFEVSAFEDFNEWASLNKKLYRKIIKLIRDIDRSPFSGLGKPEALKHDLQGYWSRRIDDEHRLVYKVTDDAIIVIGCRYHYGQQPFKRSHKPAIWNTMSSNNLPAVRCTNQMLIQLKENACQAA